jgi:hypothetical protein
MQTGSSWALGDWLFLALIYRVFVYDPQEKFQASRSGPLHTQSLCSLSPMLF